LAPHLTDLAYLISQLFEQKAQSLNEPGSRGHHA